MPGKTFPRSWKVAGEGNHVEGDGDEGDGDEVCSMKNRVVAASSRSNSVLKENTEVTDRRFQTRPAAGTQGVLRVGRGVGRLSMVSRRRVGRPELPGSTWSCFSLIGI